MLKADPFWETNCLGIQDKLERNIGLSSFLSWPEISSTMFASRVDDIETKLLSLYTENWSRWHVPTREDSFGGPTPSQFDNGSSDNLLQQAYHIWVFEQLSGQKIHSLGGIVEVGGGYGACAKLCKRLGHKGEYTIFDLPVLTELQIVYLHNIEITGVHCTSRESELDSDIDLLMGIHSISEMPIEEREKLLTLTNPRFYYFVFGEKFDRKIDNLDWFLGKLPKLLPSYNWATHQQGSSYYLIGDRLGDIESNPAQGKSV